MVGAALQANPRVFSPTRLLLVLEGSARRANRYSERKELEPERVKAVATDIGFAKR